MNPGISFAHERREKNTPIGWYTKFMRANDLFVFLFHELRDLELILQAFYIFLPLQIGFFLVEKKNSFEGVRPISDNHFSILSINKSPILLEKTPNIIAFIKRIGSISRWDSFHLAELVRKLALLAMQRKLRRAREWFLRVLERHSQDTKNDEGGTDSLFFFPKKEFFLSFM